jgi:hypothetical protein
MAEPWYEPEIRKLQDKQGNFDRNEGRRPEIDPRLYDWSEGEWRSFSSNRGVGRPDPYGIWNPPNWRSYLDPTTGTPLSGQHPGKMIAPDAQLGAEAWARWRENQLYGRGQRALQNQQRYLAANRPGSAAAYFSPMASQQAQMYAQQASQVEAPDLMYRYREFHNQRAEAKAKKAALTQMAVGAGMVVGGAVLTATGAGAPLGVGLMAGGAGMMANSQQTRAAGVQQPDSYGMPQVGTPQVRQLEEAPAEAAPGAAGAPQGQPGRPGGPPVLPGGGGAPGGPGGPGAAPDGQPGTAQASAGGMPGGGDPGLAMAGGGGGGMPPATRMPYSGGPMGFDLPAVPAAVNRSTGAPPDRMAAVVWALEDDEMDMSIGEQMHAQLDEVLLPLGAGY